MNPRLRTNVLNSKLFIHCAFKSKPSIFFSLRRNIWMAGKLFFFLRQNMSENWLWETFTHVLLIHVANFHVTVTDFITGTYNMSITWLASTLGGSTATFIRLQARLNFVGIIHAFNVSFHYCTNYFKHPYHYDFNWLLLWLLGFVNHFNYKKKLLLNTQIWYELRNKTLISLLPIYENTLCAET